MALQHIETIELGSSQSSITFSSIPQDYDDLVLLISAKQDISSSSATIEFNGVSTNLSGVELIGDGAAVNTSSTTRISVRVGTTSVTANTFSSNSVYVSNYTASQANSVSVDSVTENNGTTAFQEIAAALWNDTSAITQLTINSGGNFITGSTASLYGVTAGGDGTVTTA